MANRHDRGSDSAPENRRPISQNEDAMPEMIDEDDIRGRADEEEDDEFEDAEMDETDEEDADEGTF